MTVSPAGTKAGSDRGGVVVCCNLVYDGKTFLRLRLERSPVGEIARIAECECQQYAT